MLRKIVSVVILLPLMAVIVAFAVANRETVTLSFDPFSSAAPAYAITLPMFVILFIVLNIGVIVGGIAVWFGQRHIRRARRRIEADLNTLRGEIDALRQQPPGAPPNEPARPTPPLIAPPAA